MLNANGSVDRAAVERIVRQVAIERLQQSKIGMGSELIVQASSRHVHLHRKDMDTLFGAGSELTFERELYQPGNFAAKEMVTLVGLRGRVISNLRILGPLRNYSQVELAYTDAITLGFTNVPVRLSGDIAGAPGAVVVGPKGVVELKEGVIRAAIHVHMNPQEAAQYGVSNGDRMKLRVDGPMGLTFEQVHVRVDPSSRLNVHMDTDEANACGLHQAKGFQLFK